MRSDISKAELKIMNVLWDHGTLPLREIVVYLNMPWKNATILTLLARLQEKEYISHVRQGRRQFYTATHSKEECLKKGYVEFMEDWNLSVPELLAVVEECGAVKGVNIKIVEK